RPPAARGGCSARRVRPRRRGDDTMMNELVLEDLLAQIADDIPVPARGTQRVLDAIDAAATPYRRDTSRFPQVLAVAAAIVVVGGLGLLIANGGSRTESKASLAGGQ